MNRRQFFGVTGGAILASQMPSAIKGMNVLEAIKLCPHLASPAALASADTNGKWKMARHLSVINRELMNVGFGLTDRVGVHLPFSARKILALFSLLSSLAIALVSAHAYRSGELRRALQRHVRQEGARRHYAVRWSARHRLAA